ncbi:NnrS family protein [Suttonella sp. R2A3]|uniref:NnrS family protein n=1 Tax=Suttonella sp. R2A3 TaxID=2908648 RepID=UPI001F4700A1|nr:NnrS family protein [Suttonella sp. R2A3]UJF25267.1 NnrS family protein [Suttonella sp. R2A3]
MRSAIFNLGFRLFFASAAVFAVFTMVRWLFLYSLHIGSSTMAAMNPFYWHGHEMVFGYSFAVVAGFLLTATGVWTQQKMPHGYTLFFIWLPWLLARVLFFFGALLPLAMVLDTIFALALLYFFAKPVFAVKQWRQMGIFSKLVLMVIANLLFMAGSFGPLARGQHWGLYLALFIIIALVLTIGRRVMPFFIKSATGFAVRHYPWTDRTSLLGFFGFVVLDIFTPWHSAAALFALVAAIAMGWRLIGWHTPSLWKKPLLWSMYLSMWCIVIGFLMLAVRLWLPVPISLSIAMHMLALGGIGIMTFSMIGRVSLGHTGRNIHAPPKRLLIGFYLLFAALIFRVIMPIILPEHYVVWMIHAQVAWTVAFVLLVSAYWLIWISARPDGKFG